MKSYSELISLPTFMDRYNYLYIGQKVGDETFGSRRYLNQLLYHCDLWLNARDKAIIRDNACDLAMPDRKIEGRILVHHINPITIADILDRNHIVFDLDNLVTTTKQTHDAIHYGNPKKLPRDPIVRSRNDTCPWLH